MKKIKTEKEYEAIISRVDELMAVVDDSTPTTDKNMIELDFLTDLVIAYEKEHFPVTIPTLSEVVKLRMYEMNLTQKKLAELLGVTPSRVSEIINEKKEPTYQMAREISRKLNISPNIVLGV